MLISEDVLQSLLNDTAAVHLSRQSKNVTPHLVGEDLLLSLVTVLEQLLNHVVAKDIGHQLQAVRLNLAEDLFFFVTVGSLQLLLNEAGAVLITTELHNVVVDVLQLVALVALAVGSELFK